MRDLILSSDMASSSCAPSTFESSLTCGTNKACSSFLGSRDLTIVRMNLTGSHWDFEEKLFVSFPHSCSTTSFLALISSRRLCTSSANKKHSRCDSSSTLGL